MKHIYRLLAYLFALTIVGSSSGSYAQQKSISFSGAKRLLEQRVYADASVRHSFYCACAFDSDKQVAPQQCGYESRKNEKRGKRIEWEHIVPASRFGQPLSCWREGHDDCVSRSGRSYKGRRCCAKVNASFQRMEADMHNLVPAVGELNGDRSNRPLGEVAGEQRSYGACDFEVDFATDVAEPRAAVRGEVARAYLYMRATYGLALTDAEAALYESWSAADPVSPEELRRNRLIFELQGNINPFIAPGF
ncbi:endonuclease [Polycladidibacter hongkongensis]|uniref:endonuclease n=1 Tax=Polycladidibacter hongkongensis TaxID=1647556 RepID=UPI001AD935E1|nr:endonuclease [Pseudovibrio hongkongensis]